MLTNRSPARHRYYHHVMVAPTDQSISGASSPAETVRSDVKPPPPRRQGLLAAAGSWAEVPYSTLVPGPTRAAIADLVSDMHAKPFLDVDFWERHVPAFKPTSTTGWLGLSATVLLAVAGLSSLGCLALAIVAGLSYLGVFLAMATTIILNIAGVFVFAGLMMTSLFSSSMGFALAAGYATLRLGSLVVERAKQS